MKLWRAALIDSDGDFIEYVVAVGSRSLARQALLQLGVRANVGDLTTTDPVDVVLNKPGRVFKRRLEETGWVEA